MKIQFNGDKWKLIPKKYKDIKDIGRFMVSEKLRLTVGERIDLNQELFLMKFVVLYKEWEKGLSVRQKEIIGRPAIAKTSYIAQIRTRERIYYVIRFEGNPEVECTESMYRVARKISKINDQVITRIF